MKENRILLIIGNQRRHLYFASLLQRVYNLDGIILVDRGIDRPIISENIEKIDRENFEKHFENRKTAEEEHLRDIEELQCDILHVDFDKLNTMKSVLFIEKINPHFVFVFGSGLIKEPIISVLPKETINLHLGLSPRYRGSATLFWPFYFLEPNYAGSTFHYLEEQPDSGAIIHQVTPQLEYGDKIHDVACKVIVESSNALVKLLKTNLKNNGWKNYPQKHSGKNFLDSDFHPAHLRLIYNTFNDDIVDHYLNNELRNRQPRIINQFKEFEP